MEIERYVVMGAGEVGCHLAKTLSTKGHHVTVIDTDPSKRQLVEEQLDTAFVLGNGAQVPTLEAAEVGSCDLFVAASSSDEVNLAASLLAKRVGAKRTVVRIASSEGVTRYGRTYEQIFNADLLLSTQLLTTTRILNTVLGYNTLEVEYMAGGEVQVRRTQVEAQSPLCRDRLADVDLPAGSLVLAYISDGRLVVPSGDTRAQPGDDALVLATSDVIDEVESRISGHARKLGTLVIAGGGQSAQAVAARLESQARTVKIIEADRARAEELAALFPRYDIIHGNATDVSVLTAEDVGRAKTFIALTGNDETNLMACLMAQELGARGITALVQKSETSSLWKKVGLLDVVSPRTLAAEYIDNYIHANYEPHVVSIENDTARFIHRVIAPQSPAAGERLADVEIPSGLIIAAVLTGGRALVPRGDHQLRVGDEVILFVRAAEVGTAQLLFPGRDEDVAASL
jgi:trk system potassium uptake protein TrkA